MGDNKIYKITLSNGVVINDLRLNGNNFISKEKVSKTMFDGNCSRIIINDGNSEEIYDNVELVRISENQGEYWFVLRCLSEIELIQMKNKSDIEYIAMMVGISL